MPDFATEYGARSVLDDCLFGCVFRLRKRCLVCGATADVLQHGIRMVTLELLGNNLSDLQGLCVGFTLSCAQAGDVSARGRV